MDYLATVRDGSTGKLVNGYWLVEMYASVRRKNPLPILLEAFSHEHPDCPGQNPVVIDAVRRVLTLTEGRGVLVVDRGGDARVFLNDWLDNAYRFVVRMRGDRDLMRFYAEGTGDGQWIAIEARYLAERLIGYAQVLPDKVDFMFYRLLTGLTHILNACFYIRRALL